MPSTVLPTRRWSRRRSVAAAVSLAGATLGATWLVPASAGAAASARATRPGSTPAWAASGARQGAADPSATVHLLVGIPLPDQAAAEATALAVSTPGSPQYRHFLTPAQWRKQFSPRANDVATVTKWLRDEGFSIANTPDDGAFVAVEGTVAQAAHAFGTTVGQYAVKGMALRAPDSALSVPSTVAGLVDGVVGLDESDALIHPNTSTGSTASSGRVANAASHGAPSAGFRVGTPCSSWYGEKTVEAPPAYGTTTKPLAPCGYTPKQIEGLYGLDAVYASGHDGTGQTVAFVGADASPTIVSDLTTYSQRHGLPAPSIRQIVAPGTYNHPVTKRNDPSGFYGEESLDAEAIHATAPGATLLFVGSSNAGQDFNASINHIVDKGLASIISISYGFAGEGLPTGWILGLEKTLAQAAAQGIGVFASSGDDGDDVIDFGTPAVDFEASSPFLTAVGGTSAAIVPDGTNRDPNASGWKRSFEVGWQVATDTILVDGKSTSPTPADDRLAGGTYAKPLPGTFQAGGGGGLSSLFARPAYQQGVTDGYSTTRRALPDISADADANTGFLVGQTQAFPDGNYYDEFRLGGTSLAAPLTAGMAALANDVAGHPLGFLNPKIYDLYRTQASTVYYDVDQQDLFCGGHACTTNDPLPAQVRVNLVNSVDASDGYAYVLRTEETNIQTLHSVAGYDLATGVGTPNGLPFITALGS